MGYGYFSTRSYGFCGSKLWCVAQFDVHMISIHSVCLDSHNGLDTN